MAVRRDTAGNRDGDSTPRGPWHQLFFGPFLFGLAAFPLLLVGRTRRLAEIRLRQLDGRPARYPRERIAGPAESASGPAESGPASTGSTEPAPAEPAPAEPAPAEPGRSLGAAVLILLPLTLIAFLLALLTAYLVWAGELYPLRPGALGAVADPFAPVFGPGTWGGPTLVGAWFVHAMAALGMQLIACTGIRGIGALCRRITSPRLGI